MAILTALALSAGAVVACPYGQTAQTSEQQTTASSDQVPLPADGAKTTETKTGG
jgi:hypothetical protein